MSLVCVCVCVSVSDLEFILLDDTAGLQVLTDLVKDGQHGDVSLAGASRGADQKVFIGVVGCLKHHGLNPVQTLHPFEHQLPDLSANTNKEKERQDG